MEGFILHRILNMYFIANKREVEGAEFNYFNSLNLLGENLMLKINRVDH